MGLAARPGRDVPAVHDVSRDAVADTRPRRRGRPVRRCRHEYAPCSRSAVPRARRRSTVVNVRAPSRLSPVRYVTVLHGRGIDERGAARYRGAAEGLEAVELPRASGVTARPPATASGGRPRRGAGRRHREAVDAGGVVLPGSDPPPGRTASLSEGRRRVAAGQPHCARPPQRYGPSRDTPPAPRLGGQSGALRPGLDARVPTVRNVPGTRRATELRTPPPDRNRRSRCRGTPPFGRRADVGVGWSGGAAAGTTAPVTDHGPQTHQGRPRDERTAGR